jgi:formate hydrogenlyase subunit 3/multisubunit Na+/H+ antiporter MnhD subunit
VAIIGMPLSAIFLPKISLLLQAAAISPVLLLGLLVVFLFVAAAFGIFMIKMLSRKEEDTHELKPFHAGWGMKIPIIILLAVVFALGVFFPQQLTNLLNAIVTELGF